MDKKAMSKLVIAIVFCIIFMIGEIVGGYISGSLAIMTDAAHLLSDVAGFLISLCAISWSRKRASASMSYGYHRAEILGALFSISMVWALTGFLLMEAADRLHKPQPIDGKMMFIVAVLGVIVNAVIGFVLHEHHHHTHDEDTIVNGRSPSPSANMNVKAAFIHAIGDLIQSVGVLIAALIIWYKPEWHVADPLCTFFFSILVVASTWFLARDTIIILMEGTPKNVCSNSLRQKLASIEGVFEVHDLHVWSLAPGKTSATVHIVVDWSRLRTDSVFYERVLGQCQAVICNAGIHHITIQVDPAKHLNAHCRIDCCGSDSNFLLGSSGS